MQYPVLERDQGAEGVVAADGLDHDQDPVVLDSVALGLLDAAGERARDQDSVDLGQGLGVVADSQREDSISSRE